MSVELKPIHWWQMLWRSAFEVERSGETWTVDIDFVDYQHLKLFRNGELYKALDSPARFELPDGAVIEVATSYFVVKYVRLVAGDKVAPLRPVEGSAEAWRADMARQYPRISRAMDLFSWTVLVVAAVTQLPRLVLLAVNALGFTVPDLFTFPAAVDNTLSILGLIAAADRAMRQKYNPWLD